MTASAPARDTRNAGSSPLMPPDEKFWRRYSPHHEAPLSFAGSVAVHALAIGTLILFAVYFVTMFFNSNHSLPIEPVRLQGGGSGSKTGPENSKGPGGAPNGIGELDMNSQPGEADVPIRTTLTPAQIKIVEEKYDEDDSRRIQESTTGKRLERLEQGLRNKLDASVNPGVSDRRGPGLGDRKGPGIGPGSGKTKLTLRQKRMLRWNMRFTANTGPDYLAQLRALGAILAFEQSDKNFKIVRDLRPGARLLDEDVTKLNRIYWFDDNPRSVADVLAMLGIRMSPVPSRFVAFMPKELEKQLFDMERRYVENTLRRKFEEHLIDETLFRVVLTGRGYRPELISVSMR
jgi:hypothetical protein